MYKLKATGETYPDCTAHYEVILDKEYTVKEFLEELLQNGKEWGIVSVNSFLFLKYRYKEYEIEVDSTSYDNLIIDSITSIGGYSRMDYFIKTK